MADLSRWDPFGDMISLRDAMDRLLRESFVRPGATGSGGTGSFPLELGETADGYVVRAQMPGVKPEDVHVTVHGDVLTISGESQQEEDRDVQQWHMRERQSSSFQRSVRLPSHVDADKAEAHCEHGVIVLNLPKAESAKPRQIPITSSISQPKAEQPDSIAAQRGEERREDVVTESSDMSFPASDPPSWTPGHTGSE